MSRWWRIPPRCKYLLTTETCTVACSPTTVKPCAVEKYFLLNSRDWLPLNVNMISVFPLRKLGSMCMSLHWSSSKLMARPALRSTPELVSAAMQTFKSSIQVGPKNGTLSCGGSAWSDRFGRSYAGIMSITSWATGCSSYRCNNWAHKKPKTTSAYESPGLEPIAVRTTSSCVPIWNQVSQCRAWRNFCTIGPAPACCRAEGSRSWAWKWCRALFPNPNLVAMTAMSSSERSPPRARGRIRR